MCKICAGKPEGQRPPDKERKDNIEMDLRKIEFEVLVGFIWLRIQTSSGIL